eukprot:TRINITY_DN2091_c0_g1_i1.p1 TRINITY_DN2091_c0_g1~~TRINITY_DN2091_c0_g1_i1.p1  ORF type:complete len:345 (-),score=69.54 TRINITY_DN2091_c0_g1_i1:128-1162(-)
MLSTSCMIIEPLLKPLRVCVTGAAGSIAYSLLPLMCSGRTFGFNQPLDVVLFDVKAAETLLGGVVMEVLDGAFPLVHSILGTTDPEVAFKDADQVIMLGAKPRGPGMERADLLLVNASIFIEHGIYLDRLAKKTAKICVVGNPVNTNAYILTQVMKNIPARNITALTRLDHNRSIGQISQKTGELSIDIHNVVVWGNHSSTMYPDLTFARLRDGRNVIDLIDDPEWIEGEFLKTIRGRGSAVIKARGHSSAMSAAVACSRHCGSLHRGTLDGEWVSMGVVSDGSYGIPKGIVFSFPCTAKNGEWEIVQGLDISEKTKGYMEASLKELEHEKEIASSLLPKDKCE